MVDNLDVVVGLRSWYEYHPWLLCSSHANHWDSSNARDAHLRCGVDSDMATVLV